MSKLPSETPETEATFIIDDVENLISKELKTFMLKYEIDCPYDAKYLFDMNLQRIKMKQYDLPIYFWSSRNKIGYEIH